DFMRKISFYLFFLGGVFCVFFFEYVLKKGGKKKEKKKKRGQLPFIFCQFVKGGVGGNVR
ncbi:hypothetical protein, partial [Bacillus sp. GbtcB13]|uniref:hypothetical protein n=1 Tax=Bacillus sp. GbtcB13 TaxID=2824758 RepID=UPI001C2F5614